MGRAGRVMRGYATFPENSNIGSERPSIHWVDFGHGGRGLTLAHLVQVAGNQTPGAAGRDGWSETAEHLVAAGEQISLTKQLVDHTVG